MISFFFDRVHKLTDMIIIIQCYFGAALYLVCLGGVRLGGVKSNCLSRRRLGYGYILCGKIPGIGLGTSKCCSESVILEFEMCATFVSKDNLWLLHFVSFIFYFGELKI